MSSSVPSANQPSGLVEAVKKDAANQYIGAKDRAEQHALASAAWHVVHRALATLAAVLAAITGAAILADAQGGWRVVVGVLALCSAVFSAVDTTTKAAELADEHKRGADGFTELRTKWLLLRDFAYEAGLSPTELKEGFEDLLRRRDELTTRVPLVPMWSVKAVIKRRQEEAQLKQRTS